MWSVYIDVLVLGLCTCCFYVFWLPYGVIKKRMNWLQVRRPNRYATQGTGAVGYNSLYGHYLSYMIGVVLSKEPLVQLTTVPTLMKLQSSRTPFLSPVSIQTQRTQRTQRKRLRLDGNQALQLIVCLRCAVQCGLETYFWTGINQLFIWGSIVSYFCVTLVTHTALFEHYYEGVAFNCMITANFWFTILLCTVILLVPVLAEKFYYTDTRPTVTDNVIIVSLLWLFLLWSSTLLNFLIFYMIPKC